MSTLMNIQRLWRFSFLKRSLLLVFSGLAFLSAQEGVSQDRGLVWNATASTDIAYIFPDGTVFSQADSWGDIAETLQSGFYTGLTTLRLGFQGGNRDSAQLVGLIKLAVPYGTPAESFASSSTSAPYDLVLTKLYVTFSFPQMDLSLGRMIVNYGKGRLFSPSDLFSVVDLQDQALGRFGTDVARLQLPLSDLAGIDLVSTLALTPAKAVFGGRAFTTLGGWDVSTFLFQNGGGLAELQSGTASPDAPTDPVLLGGFDWKGDLLLGLYGEVLFTIPYEGPQLAGERAGYTLALGADYSFGGSWFCTVEYQGNFGQGSRFGQFQADTSLFGSLSWKIDHWTSSNGYIIYTVDAQAWQALIALNRTLMPRTSLSVYTAASRGNVRTSATGTDSTPLTLAVGLTLGASF